jgi:hypothetical protein
MNLAPATALPPELNPPPLTGSAPRELLWLFPKLSDTRFTANFTLREFHCRCQHSECYSTLVHPRLVDTLQTLRELVARPLVITSGFRCRLHNDRVGGRPRSFHLQGMAADIACPDSVPREELLEAARRVPAVGGLGSYPGQGYVHLDVRRRAAGAAIVEWSE